MAADDHVGDGLADVAAHRGPGRGQTAASGVLLPIVAPECRGQPRPLTSAGAALLSPPPSARWWRGMTPLPKKFGQSERMTVRIRQLIRNYTRGPGILKEFLQNADDAGATRVDVWIDWRTHDASRLPDARMATFAGPALLVANDREFTSRDLEAIQRIGEGSKLLDGSKTGRFGLGFNTAYNVTDHPSFVTGDSLYCMDPHASAVTRDGTGESWPLQRAWQEFPDWPALFTAGGLAPGCDRHAGTIFRLPLRDAAQAAVSEISRRPFTRGDLEEILQSIAQSAASLVLFARHLRELTITEVTRDGQRQRLRVVLVNADQVESARGPLVAALGEDLKASVRRWRAEPTRVPLLTTWRHSLDISVDASTPRRETWYVTAGLVRGDQDRLLEQAHTLVEQFDESAVPWVGAAARITSSTPARASAVAGALHCTFSLPPPVSLPVHINGCFDLDDARQRLTLATKDNSAAQRLRGEWNQALLVDGCARAWIDLLTRLAADGVDGLYDLWPDPSRPHDALTQAMIDAFYQRARTAPLIRVRVGDELRLATAAELRVLPAQPNKDLRDALLADGLPLPDPPLPAHVRRGLAPTELSPADLRRMLRDTPAFRGPLVDAPRPSLRRPEWIEAMLAFCCSDDRPDLADLPLALTCDDQLRAFGPAAKGPIFLAADAVRALFPGYRALFLAPRLARYVAEVKQAGLRSMTPHDVVALLKHMVGTDTREWQPDGEHPPNSAWLAQMLEHLAEHRLDDSTLAVLRNCALLPGHDGRLHPAAARPPPLLASGAPSGLLARLRELGVVTLVAPPAAAAALTAVSRRHPTLAAAVTGAAVVEALSARSEALAELDRQAACDLLRWLAGVELTDTERRTLAGLPLLPTNAGPRRASDREVFLPAGFRPPQLGTTIALVDVPGGCTSLVRQLGVATLQPHTFIEQQLVPELASMSPDDRARAWSWLRDELPTLLRGLEAPAAEKLRRAIASVPAFPAVGGALAAVTALYDPDSELVLDVLGEGAALPDPAAIRDERPRWLELLRSLGIAREPRLGDIFRHLTDLRGRGPSAADAIRRVSAHFEKNWSSLDGREVPGERVTVQRWLSEASWLPPLSASTAPGFLAPAARLYRPNELYTDVALVGSQAPVCAWPVESKLADAIGLRRRPPPVLVLRHFEHLLDTFPNADEADAFDGHARALSPIYNYLHRLHQSREHRANSDEQTLRERLRARPCLWDISRRRAWLPAHVFIDDVRKLEPLRTNLDLRIPEGAVRYLGGKQRPEAEDYCAWMRDLAALIRGPLDPEQRLQALYVLRHVGDPGSVGDLPLLCTDGRLRPASTVLLDDAPWLKERPADLFCVDPDVPGPLLKGLGVQGVADALQERLQGVESGGVTPEAERACKTLQDRLRAPEFTVGLIRLVRHTHGPDAAPDLAPVARLTLRPVARLRTSFVLHGREIASGEARHFFQTSDATLMLVGHQEARLVTYVARAVHQLLGAEMQLADTAPLEHILLCDDPAAIGDVLDDDRVRDLHIHYEETPEADEPAPDAPAEPAGEADEPAGATAQDTPNSAASTERPGPRSASSAPGTFTGRATRPDGDRFKSRLAQLAAELADSPAPSVRSVEDRGLAIPRRDASIHRPVGGIQPGLQSRVVTDEVPEALTREIEEQALAVVMAAELAAGRDPERMSQDHPGFNILSRDPASREVLRFIEVKGTHQDWRWQPIRLTIHQLVDALRDPARSWLYIVERLGGEPRLRKIRAFVEHIVGFTVDAESWAPLCETAPPPTQPREGHQLHGRDGPLGTIRGVSQGGALVIVTLERPDGTTAKIPFRPSEHSLKEVDDGEDIP